MNSAPSQKTLFQRFGYQFIRITCYIAFRVLFRLRVFGRENIPQTGPVLICPNHQSHLDPMLIGSSSPRRMNFLAKKQLFSFWPLAWIIRFLDSIPLDREGMSAGGIKETLKRMKRAEMALLFPEGTRSPDGEFKKVLPGFCALVKRTGANIVPVGIQGAAEAWPRKRSFPMPGHKIVIVFGKPISKSDYEVLSDQELVVLLDRRIREMIAVSRQYRQKRFFQSDPQIAESAAAEKQDNN
jgi:1-acyl-sn-glycerol-3-phosphate acyltransferase